VRAAVVGAGGQYEVVTLPNPSPGPGELLLRVTACGLCGSDLKARMAMPRGTIMGHEFGGEVIATGDGTPGWCVGSHAAVLPVGACGQCPWCTAGYVAHCRSARLIGLGAIGGGFAELAVVPAPSAFLLPPGLDPAVGAVVEPFAVGLHVIRAAGLAAGEDALVIGTGAVGLTAIAWARAHGAGRITAVDPVGSRRDAARSFGATDALASLDDAEGSGYDVVIECAGRPGLLDGCVAAARPRGRVIVAGTCLEPTSLMPIVALMKEVSIGFAVYYTPQEFSEVIAAFADGRIDPAALVSRRLRLADLNDAFDDLARTAAGAKTLIEPWTAGPAVKYLEVYHGKVGMCSTAGGPARDRNTLVTGTRS
jgi:(R,R)-butanediol dehydrogenase/meso-butanediol dehydrogenase/diacetyl reductase